MRVIATKDGHYGGLYRVEGEVFDISDAPILVKDVEGKAIAERDAEGKVVKHNGKIKFKTTTWFTPEWMAEVPAGTLLTRDPQTGLLRSGILGKVVGHNGVIESGVAGARYEPEVPVPVGPVI